jgi:hypothetical protein
LRVGAPWQRDRSARDDERLASPAYTMRVVRFAWPRLSRVTPRPPAWGIGSVISVAVAAMILLFVFFVGDAGFEQSFLANFLATLAGVAVGVPVAIWLTLHDANEQRKLADQQERDRASGRRQDVLTAVRHELDENKVALAERRKTGKRELIVPFLQDEVWAAMSDGGELRWITDAALLRQMARSYHFIRTAIFLETQVFEVRFYAGLRIAGGPSHTDIIDILDRLDPTVLAAINEGIAAIDAAAPGLRA